MKVRLYAAAAALVHLMAPWSYGGAILTTGKIRMGVRDTAGLGFGGTGSPYGAYDYDGVGLELLSLKARVGAGDAITPGCLCEGWGAAADGNGNFGDYGNSGTQGIASATFTPGGPDTATSTVLLTNGLKVVHDYSPAAGGLLFRVLVTLTNTTMSPMTDVRYARTLDWDVPPGHFTDDFTTIYGGSPSGPAGNVFHTSLNPFAFPNPMVTRGTFPDQNRVDEPGDLGAYFILKFGNLASGASISFDTYIGAADTKDQLLAALGSVGVEAYSYSFDNDRRETFGWGFKGLGLPPAPLIPEPSTYALMGLGLVGLGVFRRRQKK